MSDRRVQVVILAAGKGTRMRANQPKVLAPVLGTPLLAHVLRQAAAVEPSAVTVVVGHGAEDVEAAFAGRCRFARQTRQLGTGDALRAATEAIRADGAETLLVLNGDLPLLRAGTLRRVLARHRERRAAATLLTGVLEDPGRYGRVIRDESGSVRAIVEAKDATPEQLAVREINVGTYVFRTDRILPTLAELETDNAQGEYYLTDAIAALVAGGDPVVAVAADDAREVLGVNDQRELAEATRILRERRLAELLDAGVVIEDPATTTVSAECVVEPGATLLAGTRLEGRCEIATGATLGPWVRLADSTVGCDARVLDHCVVVESTIAAGASVGPFCHVRPGSQIGEGSRVGNFVELKKTRLGPGAKASHLSYLGDAEVGANANVGAGTITCNYDGVSKHRTEIGAGAFVGSDSVLVAPVRVGDGAYIAAASAITKDVPDDALGVARARQTNKPGWAARRRQRTARSD